MPDRGRERRESEVDVFEDDVPAVEAVLAAVEDDVAGAEAVLGARGREVAAAAAVDTHDLLGHLRLVVAEGIVEGIHRVLRSVGCRWPSPIGLVGANVGRLGDDTVAPMRIVAGESRGRRIATVEGADVRPTMDRVREAVFNSLESHGLIDDRVFVDAFAGSGALGLEALSRGAAEVLFVDIDRRAVATVEAPPLRALIVDVVPWPGFVAAD